MRLDDSKKLASQHLASVQTSEYVVLPVKGLLRGQIAGPVGQVEEAEREREDDSRSRVNL
jgi:hypothetical protein